MMHHFPKFYSCLPFIDFSIFSWVIFLLCVVVVWVTPACPTTVSGWSGLNNPTDRQRDRNWNIIKLTNSYRNYRKQRKEKKKLNTSNKHYIPPLSSSNISWFCTLQHGHSWSMKSVEFSNKSVTELLEVHGIWTVTQEKVYGEQG